MMTDGNPGFLADMKAGPKSSFVRELDLVSHPPRDQSGEWRRVPTPWRRGFGRDVLCGIPEQR